MRRIKDISRLEVALIGIIALLSFLYADAKQDYKKDIAPLQKKATEYETRLGEIWTLAFGLNEQQKLIEERQRNITMYEGFLTDPSQGGEEE